MRLTLRVAAIPAVFALLAFPVLARKGEPERIVVQHILIGFKKTVPDKPQERTKHEAKLLAEQLLERAQAGEDFDALVKEHTDDTYPGIMIVTNQDAPRVPGGRGRNQLVAKFGDVAFRLEVGEVGLASYHAALAPYGYHVIKRLE